MFTGSGENNRVEISFKNILSFKNIISWFRSYYDKIIALGVLTILVGSLLYLALQIGMMHSVKASFDRELRNLKPKYPNPEKLETKVFTDAMDGIEHPLTLTSDTWTNAMVFTPEKRFWCLGCRKPIPMDFAFAGKKCPLCQAVQVEGGGVATIKKSGKEDTDTDGIPDVIEKATTNNLKYVEKGFKLDYNDPLDADKDFDNDGFTNKEELMAKELFGRDFTDPTDPVGHPPYVTKIHLIKVVQDPFKLRFKGVTRLPDGNLVFQLNLRGNVGTGFAHLDETIAEVSKAVTNNTARGPQVVVTKTVKVFKAATNNTTDVSKVVTNEVVEGFKLVKYEKKEAEQFIQGIGKRMVDVSELTLQRGDKMIVLVKDQDVQWDEYTAQLKTLFKGDNVEYTVKNGDVFEVKNEKFKVNNVDMAKQTVLIESLNTGEKITIPDNKNVVPADKAEKANKAEKKEIKNLKPAEVQPRRATL